MLLQGKTLLIKMGLRNHVVFVISFKKSRKKKRRKKKKKRRKKDIKNTNGSCTKLPNFKEFNFEIVTL